MQLSKKPENYFQQQSERLDYRKLMPSDIKDWVSFFIDNPSLKYLGVDLKKDATTLANEWITKQFDRYAKDGLGHLAIIKKETGELIGNAGILVREIDELSEFEIAYSFKPKYWGQGYGTEAAQQLKKFGLEHQISNRFISIIDKANTASINVAKKNGMKIFRETTYLVMDVFIFMYEQ